MKLCKLPLLASSAKNTHHCRTVELRQSRPPLPLHRRTASNLALPPYGAILRPVNKCAFPLQSSQWHTRLPFSSFLEDTWHYWSHRTLHTPRLYVQDDS